MKECDRIRALISDPGVPDLAREDAELVFDHIEGCPECRLAFEQASLMDCAIAESLDQMHSEGYALGLAPAANAKADEKGGSRMSRRSLLRFGATGFGSFALGAAAFAEARAKWPAFTRLPLGVVIHRLVRNLLCRSQRQVLDVGHPRLRPKPSETEVSKV